ncbi:hypothetical protein ACKUUO_38505 [Streptomyces sp. MCC57]
MLRTTVIGTRSGTVTGRVVQASLKLVLEPVFEADFLPCSYGFRPKRRAHDALAEAHHFAKSSYEWMVEGDSRITSPTPTMIAGSKHPVRQPHGRKASWDIDVVRSAGIPFAPRSCQRG